jgi:hypothetical protein
MPATLTNTTIEDPFDPQELLIERIDGRRTVIDPRTIVASAVQYEADAIYVRLDDRDCPEFWLTLIIRLGF